MLNIQHLDILRMAFRWHKSLNKHKLTKCLPTRPERILLPCPAPPHRHEQIDDRLGRKSGNGT